MVVEPGGSRLREWRGFVGWSLLALAFAAAIVTAAGMPPVWTRVTLDVTDKPSGEVVAYLRQVSGAEIEVEGAGEIICVWPPDMVTVKGEDLWIESVLEKVALSMGRRVRWGWRSWRLERMDLAETAAVYAKRPAGAR